MIRATVRILAIVTGLLAAAPRVAIACSCIEGGPACQEVFRTAGVFVGVVQSIDVVERPGPIPQIRMIQQRRVHFRVDETFRGDVGREVDVTTGMGGGDCGFGFAVGVSYLVYADGDTGHWSTGICSRTRTLASAGEDLAFLRSMSSAPAVRGTLFGVVTYQGSSMSASPPERRPFAGARVSFTSDRSTLTATTGSDGKFTLASDPGDYQVAVTVPPGYYSTAWAGWKVTLADARGCVAVNVTVRDDGRIRGRVVDSDGQPVPNLAVELGVRRARSIQWHDPERTDADGRYEFKRRESGDYVIGVNAVRAYDRNIDIGPPLFLPGVGAADQAAVVSLPPRAIIDAPDFVLPASVRMAQVSGTVLDEEGKPVSGVKVYLQADGPSLRLIGNAVVTEANGRFAFAASPGVAYKLVAERVPGRYGRNLDRAEQPGVRPLASGVSVTLRFVKK